ncbi:MAG: hypothetical protein A2V66_17540 [Ignavibacteria bacterium RBG_13_36_8]|nr:MAG: hypothetical protein A2V66_17540 [Ignavibacteria bacterium RBG_13_36_8]
MDNYPQQNPQNVQQPIYIVKQLNPETEGAGTTALWLEIIFGIFSLLGVGHVYSGRILLGIILMVGWWIYITITALFSSFTLGIGACLCIPLYFVVPIISGIQARTYIQKTSGRGSWKSVGFVAGGGCLLVIIAIIVITIILFGMGFILSQPTSGQ